MRRKQCNHPDRVVEQLSLDHVADAQDLRFGQHLPHFRSVYVVSGLLFLSVTRRVGGLREFWERVKDSAGMLLDADWLLLD
jgi:hypothetical protein